MQDKKVTVAAYIADFIARLGVDTVPFVQGGAIMKVIDAVGQHPRLKYVACNHEQAVAMFVDGYARMKGFGVGLGTSGPGGTNMLTGIACAYYDSIPCLFITGQVGMFHVKGKRRIRQRGFQETDMVAVMKPLTKHSVMLTKASEVRRVFEEAVWRAKSGRPGPVHIDVPYNVQRELVDPAKLDGFTLLPIAPSFPAALARDILAEVESAELPVLLVGGGARLAGAERLARSLARALRIPVVASWGAVDVFAYDEPLYLGSPGRYGNVSANEIVLRSDYILALGSRFTTKMVYNDKIFTGKTRVTAVDIDEGELQDGLLQHRRSIVADVSQCVSALLAELRRAPKTKRADRTAWRATARALKAAHYAINVPPPARPDSYVNPHYFVNTLSTCMGARDVFVADCGLNLCWSVQGYRSKGGNQRFISAWGNSPMGYSFPASLGAALARPRSRTVCLIGDGGMQMNIQELQTAFLYQIPVVIFILNNYCYGMMELNRPEFEGRSFGNGPDNGYAAPDFMKIAEAYGIPSFTLKDDRDVARNLTKILAKKGPLLVSVNLHPDQKPLDVVVSPPKVLVS